MNTTGLLFLFDGSQVLRQWLQNLRPRGNEHHSHAI